jgi:hypothetical protein
MSAPRRHSALVGVLAVLVAVGASMGVDGNAGAGAAIALSGSGGGDADPRSAALRREATLAEARPAK